MAGLGDEMAAAADRGHLQALHADREQAIDLLKVACVQGRLTKGELDVRVGLALVSPTQTELATLAADLPAWLIPVQSRRKPDRASHRPPVSKVAAGAATAAPPTAKLAAASLTSSEQVSIVCFVVILRFLIAWILAPPRMLANWHDERSGKNMLIASLMFGGVT